jgi:hypothetical protein
MTVVAVSSIDAESDSLLAAAIPGHLHEGLTPSYPGNDGTSVVVERLNAATTVQ